MPAHVGLRYNNPSNQFIQQLGNISTRRENPYTAYNTMGNRYPTNHFVQQAGYSYLSSLLNPSYQFAQQTGNTQTESSINAILLLTTNQVKQTPITESKPKKRRKQICTQCGRLFASGYSQRRHLRLIHEPNESKQDKHTKKKTKVVPNGSILSHFTDDKLAKCNRDELKTIQKKIDLLMAHPTHS
jgi:hypothetical protein